MVNYKLKLLLFQNFNEINFNGDTSETATNLEEGSLPSLKEIVHIKNAKASSEGYILKIVGTYISEFVKRLRNLQ